MYTSMGQLLALGCACDGGVSGLGADVGYRTDSIYDHENCKRFLETAAEMEKIAATNDKILSAPYYSTLAIERSRDSLRASTKGLRERAKEIRLLCVEASTAARSGEIRQATSPMLPLPPVEQVPWWMQQQQSQQPGPMVLRGPGMGPLAPPVSPYSAAAIGEREIGA